MLIQGGQGKDTPKEKRAAEKVVAESELLPENSSELEIVQFVLDRAGEGGRTGNFQTA